MLSSNAAQNGMNPRQVGESRLYIQHELENAITTLSDVRSTEAMALCYNTGALIYAWN